MLHHINSSTSMIHFLTEVIKAFGQVFFNIKGNSCNAVSPLFKDEVNVSSVISGADVHGNRYPPDKPIPPCNFDTIVFKTLLYLKSCAFVEGYILIFYILCENYSFGSVPRKKLQPFHYTVNLWCHDTLIMVYNVITILNVPYNFFVSRDPNLEL